MKIDNILNKYTKALTFVYLFSFMVTCFSAEEHSTHAQAKNCTIITNPTVRLQCYDTLFYSVNRLTESKAHIKPTLINPTPMPEPSFQRVNTINKVKEQSSLNDNRVDNAGKKYISTAKNEAEAIQLSLIKIEKNKYNKYIFHFENGQIWQQLEPAYIAKPKKFPVTASLTLGALNSYNLRIGNKTKKVKIKRVK